MHLEKDLYSIQEARSHLRRAHLAQKTLQTLNQRQIDTIVEAMVKAGYEAREQLAKLAVAETGFGKWQDKLMKNAVSTKHLQAYIRSMKTCGIISKQHNGKIWEVATPMGIVAAIIPSTNPTATMMYKAIISIKSRNAIVASPHPRAANCTQVAAQILQAAAEKAGAPENAIQCLSLPTRPGTTELMQHELTQVILATGGDRIVKSAYSSGKPAYGVGAGNVPVFIDRTANVQKAVADIFFGKTFDNGTLCSSEQAIVCDAPIQAQVKAECNRRGGYFLDPAAQQRLQQVMFPNGLNPEIVGKSAIEIAALAGIGVPPETTVLIAELNGVGKLYPLSGEKLSPVLAFYQVNGWQEGCDRCSEILAFGGLGHSVGVHTQDEQVIQEFALRKPAHRVLINTVCAMGAVGYTTALAPALSLGAGTIGGSITTDNITPMHLLNIKRVGFEVNPIHDVSGDRIGAKSASAIRIEQSA